MYIPVHMYIYVHVNLYIYIHIYMDTKLMRGAAAHARATGQVRVTDSRTVLALDRERVPSGPSGPTIGAIDELNRQ